LRIIYKGYSLFFHKFQAVAISTFEAFGLSGGLGLVIYGDAGRVSSVGRPMCRHRWPPDLNTAPTKKSRPCAGIRDSNLTYLMPAQNLKTVDQQSNIKDTAGRIEVCRNALVG
jgi:hypothetical protein